MSANGNAERAQESRASVDNSAWDGNAAMTACKTAADYEAICAGRKAGPADQRSSWALPHHQHPGSPPNADGVRNSLSRLPQTQGLTNREEAQRHLDRHMSAIQAQASAASVGEVRELRAAMVREQPGAIPAGAARSVAFPSRLEVRMVTRDGQQLYHLHGMANTYEQPYEMYDIFGPYKEVISRSAGAASLAKPPDVAFLVNHKGITMARTTNGTLELREEADGLHYDAYLNPKRQDVRDLVAAIEDRNIDESSFAFMIEQGGGKWNDDFTEFRINAYDIDRGDVSAVNYGANPYTSVAARSRELLADLDHAPTGLARAALQRLHQRPDLADQGSQTPAAPQAQPPAPQGRAIALVTSLLLADDDE
jgi:HK97 family phage prohead protease